MSSQKTVLYVLGGSGKDQFTHRSISRYDPETDSWNTLPTEIPFKRTDFSCVSIDNDIFVIGGLGVCPWSRNYNSPEDTFSKWNTENGKWSELPPMKYPRADCGAACTADGKYIYVAGGGSSVVERFSIETNEWTTVKPMGVAKDIVQLVELGGFIYALGRFEAERYDPETDQWSPIAKMKHEYMHGLGAAVLDGKIYVLGEPGFEMYSPEKNKWTELPVPAYFPRGRKLVALNGELLAVGGMMWNSYKRSYKTLMYMDIVENFDFEMQIWCQKADMDIGRADPGVAVVHRAEPLSETVEHLLDNDSSC